MAQEFFGDVGEWSLEDALQTQFGGTEDDAGISDSGDKEIIRQKVTLIEPLPENVLNKLKGLSKTDGRTALHKLTMAHEEQILHDFGFLLG